MKKKYIFIFIDNFIYHIKVCTLDSKGNKFQYFKIVYNFYKTISKKCGLLSTYSLIIDLNYKAKN